MCDDGDDADDEGGPRRFRVLKQQPQYVADAFCLGQLFIRIRTAFRISQIFQHFCYSVRRKYIVLIIKIQFYSFNYHITFFNIFKFSPSI